MRNASVPVWPELAACITRRMPKLTAHIPVLCMQTAHVPVQCMLAAHITGRMRELTAHVPVQRVLTAVQAAHAAVCVPGLPMLTQRVQVLTARISMLCMLRVLCVCDCPSLRLVRRTRWQDCRRRQPERLLTHRDRVPDRGDTAGKRSVNPSRYPAGYLDRPRCCRDPSALPERATRWERMRECRVRG